MNKSIKVFLVALALLLALTASALPAAAHAEGPALYCDPRTLNNCTDTGDLSAEDSFVCEGKARDAASCTDRRTGDTWSYCAFLGYEPGKDQDHYLCGPEQTHGGNHHS